MEGKKEEKAACRKPVVDLVPAVHLVVRVLLVVLGMTDLSAVVVAALGLVLEMRSQHSKN